MREEYLSAEDYDTVAVPLAAYVASRHAVVSEPRPTMARGAPTPPHMTLGNTSVTRSPIRMTIGDLRFPADSVRTRAEEMTQRARAGGAPHSLRLWRKGFEQALLSLAREACGALQTAPCEAFFWEERDDEFLVSVTFWQPARAHSH